MSPTIKIEDTIAAVASAISLGKGGVAVLRISGTNAIDACKNIVNTKSKFAWSTNRVFHGFVKDPEDGKLIDEILILTMRSPNSFTGEDVVEIHCHGGVVIVQRVLEIILKNQNVRIAEPGEFSQRAFLNGKIDLTQAESINQLISSKNIRAAEIAFNGVIGKINHKISDIKAELINQLSEIEARVDFDEDFTIFDYKKFSKKINSTKKKIENLIENSRRNAFINDGISIALIGKTNVGKSSLLNLISKKDKAIVTHIPGTTRDKIEVNLTIKNIPLKLVDTAGIRFTNDFIENIGIQKSLDMIKEADFIIYIYDLKEGFDSKDQEIIEKISKDKLITIVGNKLDLIDIKNIKRNKYSNNSIFISTKQNAGEEILLEKIIQSCNNRGLDNIDILLNERQIKNLTMSLKNLNDTSFIINNELPFDLLSIELRESIQNLSKLTGEELNEELLNNIFSKFCIGK